MRELTDGQREQLAEQQDELRAAWEDAKTEAFEALGLEGQMALIEALPVDELDWLAGSVDDEGLFDGIRGRADLLRFLRSAEATVDDRYQVLQEAYNEGQMASALGLL